MIKKMRRVIELRKENTSWWDIFLLFLDFAGISVPDKSVRNNLKEIAYINRVRTCNVFRDFIRKQEKHILIIETGVLGDGMLVVNAFRGLEKYCDENDRKLTLVCSFAMKKIFQEYAGIMGIEYVCFEDRNRILPKEFRSLVQGLNRTKYEYIVLRDSNPLGFRLAGALSAENKLYYSYDVSSRNKMERKMVLRFFTEVKEFPKDSFIPDIWKAILLRLGISGYKTRLGHISVPSDKLEKRIYGFPEREYILFCPEASNRQRSVDIDKCESVIAYLKKYGAKYDIVVSTDCRDRSYSEQLKTLVGKMGVINFIGKFSLDTFVILVSGAKLLLGCDTGAVHLAAGLGVPSICLTGYWDMPHFLPYSLDEVSASDAIPITLYPDKMPECAYCGDAGHLASQDECRKRVKEGKSLKCTYDINNKDIFEAVREVLEGYNNG